MSNYREIVTKTIIGKGKKLFLTTNSVKVDMNPTTILGCWVINHNYSGKKNNDKVNIIGSYDVNIWYSYDNDTKTAVIKHTDNYNETVTIKNNRDVVNEEVIIRSLKQPTCTNVEINDKEIKYKIEKELGIELVGDEKVKIETSLEEDPWDDIIDDVDSKIDNEVIDNVIKENTLDENEKKNNSVE